MEIAVSPDRGLTRVCRQNKFEYFEILIVSLLLCTTWLTFGKCKWYLHPSTQISISVVYREQECCNDLKKLSHKAALF